MKIKRKIKSFFRNIVHDVVQEILTEQKHDIKYGLQRLALDDTCRWIEENCPINLAFKDRYSLLSESIKHCRVAGGLNLEFGVYKGNTINHIAKKLGSDKVIYGFDSFEGLLEPWIFSNKGGFSDVKGKLPKVENNVFLIKGYFDETLPHFIEKNSEPINLLHIDSDLYSSSITIFDNLASRIIPGTVIVFDEFFNYPNWRNGEFKAWNEFVNKYSLKYEYIGYTFQRTKDFKSGNQLAIKIK